MTALLIIIGVVMVIVFSGVSDSFKRMMIGSITDSMLGHLQIHKTGYVSSIENLPLHLNINDQGLKQVEKILNKHSGTIESYSYRIKFSAMLSNYEETTNIRLTGVYPEMENAAVPRLMERINEEVPDPDNFIEQGKIIIPENIARGLQLKPGDEVLISSMEHPGGTHPWKIKEARYGIKVTEVPIGLPPQSVDEFVESFKKAITPKTKVISVSHTVYISGLISPLKELSEMAHEKGLWVAADSAHGMGMLDLNVKDSGADFSTGVGVFYVRKEMQDRLWPTITTSGWDRPTARKYETLGQRADALIIALGEAVNFQNYIGKERIEKRIKSLAGYFKQELKKIPGVKLHTSEDLYLSGGLTSFSIKGVEPRDIVDYVRQKYNIVIRTIGSPERGTYGCRVSTHYYINHKEIDQLLEGIKKVAERKI